MMEKMLTTLTVDILCTLILTYQDRSGSIKRDVWKCAHQRIGIE